MFVCIRVDSSLQIGSGHVMRCLTLAESLRNSGVEIEFICRKHNGNLNHIIRSRGFVIKELSMCVPHAFRIKGDPASSWPYPSWLGVSQHYDAEETIACLRGATPNLLVIDHYSLNKVWEGLLRPYVEKIMVIDDLADQVHDCDLLLDQNVLDSSDYLYNDLVSISCTKMIGPKYALLRPEFTEARIGLRSRTGAISNVLVFFGASDPKNYTGLVLMALSTPELRMLKVDVVVGSINQNRIAIAKMIASHPNANLHVQVANMAELMSNVDLFVGAGGATTWERLCLGLPGLVIPLSENQRHISLELEKNEYHVCLSDMRDLDVDMIKVALIKLLGSTEENKKISEKALMLLDGDGCKRVTGMILKGIPNKYWKVRKAQETDLGLLWYWANDPVVRANAHNTKKISWEKHKIWFQQKFREPLSLIVVVSSTFGSIGQVRFDQKDEGCFIDFALARQFRGLGQAKYLLRAGLNYFRETNSHAALFIGEVKETNIASAKTFESLGFQLKSITDHVSVKIRRYELAT